ncbi:MAG: hypothetical protein QM493_04450 [Sulfurovum sp.]
MKKIKIIYFIAIFIALFINIEAKESKEIDTKLQVILDLGGQMSNVRLMLESYALVGAKIPYSNPKGMLKDSILEYEALIARISKEIKDKEVKASIAKSKKAWIPVKKALNSINEETEVSIMKIKAIFIHDNIRSVIRELAYMKEYFLGQINTDNSENLNASIEIGASARRLSAHYMMKMWRLKDDTIKKHWDKGVEIYANSIAILEKSSFIENPEFKKLLKESKKELRYFIMLEKFKSKQLPTLVHKKAEKVFNNANRMSEIILSSIS